MIKGNNDLRKIHFHVINYILVIEIELRHGQKKKIQ